MIFLRAALGLPYAYLAVHWIHAEITQGAFNGHMLFSGFTALLALPFVMAIIGAAMTLSWARQAVAAGASG